MASQKSGHSSAFGNIIVFAVIVAVIWSANLLLDMVQSIPEHYYNLLPISKGADADRDGIPDNIDDSDGDGIPDIRDPDPY